MLHNSSTEPTPTPRVLSCSHFSILNKVGQGGYGKVFKAIHLSSDKTVALKFLNPEDTKGFSQSTIREIQTLQRLSHPHIVQYLGVGLATNREVFAILEYCPKSLHHMMYLKPLSPALVRSIMHDIFKGLHYMHSHHFVHRDIKAPNCLVTAEGRVKLADFGLTRFIPDASYRLTASVGPRTHPPPELIVGDLPYGVGVDIWACGVIMYELCTTSRLVPSELNEQPVAIARLVLRMFLDETKVNDMTDLVVIKKLRALVIDSSYVHLNKFVREIVGSKIENLGDLLLESLLSVNPAKRPRTDAILNHVYFADVSNSSDTALDR